MDVVSVQVLFKLFINRGLGIPRLISGTLSNENKLLADG